MGARDGVGKIKQVTIVGLSLVRQRAQPVVVMVGHTFTMEMPPP